MPDTFIVTGAAHGLGLRVVSVLAQQGKRVLAADIAEDRLEATAREERWPSARVLTHKLDIRDVDGWSAAIERADRELGGIDVCMNVAGVLHPAWAHEATVEDVDFHLDINVKGVIYGTQAAARHMLAHGGGHIINVASLAGLAPVPGLSLYCASKHAVRGFTLSAALELRDRGVAVTVVCPDAIATPMLDRQQDHEQAALTFSGREPLTSDQVAQLMCGPVLRRRPMEVTLPRDRGWLAKIANLAPDTAALALPSMLKRGQRRQRKYEPTSS